ncbi:MAG: dihydroorotate dehydrogenase electron transfer subunit [Kiritimatiellae bacterium]|nr:dihydroorotate dehydrogenase electron transfer subunit [Kiritimatiellia bacterium]
MTLEDAIVVAHTPDAGDYRRLTLRSPAIAPQVRPGQFVHVRLPAPADALLRRPFSVFRTDGDHLQLLYKPVGRGTRAMTELRPGAVVGLLGPLGHGFPTPAAQHLPVLVAGGYGMAALYLLARECGRGGLVFVGGARAVDVLCVPEFEALGWTVRVTTEDGSLGLRGLVTDALDLWLQTERDAQVPEFFACGPNGMLRAVGDRAIAGGWTAWLSLDRSMGCGVGACLTCVQKVRDPSQPGGWTWARVCREGPVFECRQIVWEETP